MFRSISSSSLMARLEWRGRLVMIGCGPTRWTVPEMKPQQEPRQEPQKKLQQELHQMTVDARRSCLPEMIPAISVPSSRLGMRRP